MVSKRSGSLTKFLHHYYSQDTTVAQLHLTLMADFYRLSMLLNILTRMLRLLAFLQMKVRLMLTKLLQIGIVLAAEKKETSKLFVPLRESGKIYKMDEHVMVAVSGIVADANYLVDEGRIVAQ